MSNNPYKKKIDRTRKIDIINFTTPVTKDLDLRLETFRAGGIDLRTNLLCAVRKDCTPFTLLKNYSNYLNDNKGNFHNIYIDGKQITTFGFLEFGLLPIYMSPLGFLAEETTLRDNYIELCKTSGIKYYLSEPYNLFTGKKIESTTSLDIWANRRDIADIVDKSIEDVRTADFHDLVQEEVVSNIINQENIPMDIL